MKRGCEVVKHLNVSRSNTSYELTITAQYGATPACGTLWITLRCPIGWIPVSYRLDSGDPNLWSPCPPQIVVPVRHNLWSLSATIRGPPVGYSVDPC